MRKVVGPGSVAAMERKEGRDGGVDTTGDDGRDGRRPRSSKVGTKGIDWVATSGGARVRRGEGRVFSLGKSSSDDSLALVNATAIAPIRRGVRVRSESASCVTGAS